MNATLHLMIVWSNAESYKDHIIGEIDSDFTIHKIFKVFWDEKSFVENLSIFYSHSLKDFSLKKANQIIKNKIRNIGTGYFYVIVFEDQSPNYQERATTSGNRVVNTNVFDMKAVFRSMTGGGSLIHCSDDSWETNKDLTLLFGLNSVDFEEKYPVHSKEIDEYKGNCKGVVGYQTESDLFYVLNNTVNYCSLSDHVIPPLKRDLNIGDAIVLLVDHKDYVIRITQAKPLFKEEECPYFFIKINGKDTLVVFRYIGDNYYDSTWEKSIILNRVCDNTDRFVPNSLDAYYSFLYHLIVHNKFVGPNDYSIAEKYADICHSDFEPSLISCIKSISSYLNENGFVFVRPVDRYVFYNSRAIAVIGMIEYIKEKLNILNVVQVHPEYRSLSDFLYFKGDLSQGEVFIKIGGLGETCENEYYMTKKAYDCSPNHFVRPIYLGVCDNINYAIYEWMEGVSVDSFLSEGNSNRERFKVQLIETYESLQRANVMHRDIRPDNLLFVDGTLKLIDFQYAIDSNLRKELRCVRNNNAVAIHLGNEKYRYKKCAWRDSASIIKILQYYDFVIDDLNLSKDKAFNMSLIQYCHACFDFVWPRVIKRLSKVFNPNNRINN